MKERQNNKGHLLSPLLFVQLNCNDLQTHSKYEESMFDFAKIDLSPYDKKKLLINPNFEFRGSYSLETGEIYSDKLEGLYKGIKILIYDSGLIHLSGSFHKYYQDGYNYQDYTFADFINTIIEWTEIFQINPFTSVLHNLEFGVNINPGINSKTIIRNILNYKGSSFGPMKNKYRKPIGIDLYTQRYGIKIYDKGNQWPYLNVNREILRFEIKVIKMEYLMKFDIKYLSDLLKPDKIKPLGELLKNVCLELILCDSSINQSILTKPEKKIFTNWSNPKYIEKLVTLDKDKFNYERRKYRKIITDYSKNKIQLKIANSILSKWDELLTIDQKTYTKLTEFLSDNENENLHQINPSNSRLIPCN